MNRQIVGYWGHVPTGLTGAAIFWEDAVSTGTEVHVTISPTLQMSSTFSTAQDELGEMALPRLAIGAARALAGVAQSGHVVCTLAVHNLDEAVAAAPSVAEAEEILRAGNNVVDQDKPWAPGAQP